MKDPFSGAELTTILVVSDMEASKIFYTDLLGDYTRTVSALSSFSSSNF